MISRPRRRAAPWIALALWLAGGAAAVAWAAAQRIHIGRMPLPQEQLMAVAAVLYALASGVGLWAYALWRWTARATGRVAAPSPVDRWPVKLAIAAAPLAAVALALYAHRVEPRRLVLRQVAVGAAGGAQGPRIAVITDLHLAGAGPPGAGIPAAVKRCQPDVVVLLGDTLNRAGALPALHQILAQVEAPLGKLAVRGNWEAWYWNELPLLQGTGFRWLDRQVASFDVRGTPLHLVGMDYRDGATGAPAEALLRRLPRDAWNVFLYHTPDLAEEVPSADLYLAGHTHGGQVSLPGYGALVTLSRFGKRFERGLRQRSGGWIYVSPGVGVEPMIPARLGVPPELSCVSLAPGGPAAVDGR